VYATVADLRAEGVTSAQASDERLAQLIDEASVFVDRDTGWWFEPRDLEVTLSGRGSPSIEPPAPTIHLTAMRIDRVSRPIDADALLIEGAPVRFVPFDPRITRRDGHVFPHGIGNVVLAGTFGYTEADGSIVGRTPPAIRRVVMRLVLGLLPRVTDASASSEAWDRWRIVAEITRDQAVRYSPVADVLLRDAALDPELAAILSRYARPIGLGAS
jgi:hypothetical protein